MTKLGHCEFSSDRMYCKQSLSTWFGFVKWVRYAYRISNTSISWFDAKTGKLILDKYDPDKILVQVQHQIKLEECKKVLDKTTKRVV